jgi:Fe-S-cluster containining protein
MKVGYLIKDSQERFNTKRSWRVVAWRVVNDQGQDMLQPWFDSKGQAAEGAKKQGISISKLQVKVSGWNTYIVLRPNCRIKNESALYHELKKELQRQGYDCIKKQPGKDGHMTSCPFYIRDRMNKWCMIYEQHEMYCPAERINLGRQLVFRNHWAIPVPKEGHNDRHHGLSSTEVGEQ